MSELFGFEFRKKRPERDLPSFAPPKDSDDGAVVVSAGGAFGTYVDLDGTVRSEAELVTKYREMSLQPECDAAVDEIVNESISIDEEHVVQINLEELKVNDNIKKIIRDEFQTCLNLLGFNKYAYEIYRRWYIDGRLYYHVIIDDKNPAAGIKEVRYVDPRKIRKVRETQKRKIQANNPGDAVVTKTVNEYFIFNDKGFNFGNKAVGPSTTGLKIAKDSILHVVSGLTDNQGTMVLSYLHKAIKPLNQLRTLEDALVIYRLARAPERRIWYIDVGNLPKMKAEQYVRDIMVKHKNRLIYDAQTGDIRDDRKFMCYSLDTKIPLLDGRTLEIKEIIKEYEEGKLNWVYSCDPVTGAFVPGPVSWAGITKQNSEVVKVTFDNGKSVICTPDHKFPVWNKGFVEAKDLAIGESLIPGYRRQKEITPGGVKYEQIFKNDTKTWEFTHREVSNWKKSLGIQEYFVHDEKNKNYPKTIIHHKNFNRFDNSPENLAFMNHKDHNVYHKDIQTILYNDEIDCVVEQCAKNLFTMQESIDFINNTIDISAWRNLNSSRNPKNRKIENLIFNQKDLLRICKKFGFDGWVSFRRNFDLREREKNGRVKRSETEKFSKEWREKLSISAKNRTDVYCKTWKIFTPDGNIEIIENLNSYCRENNLNRSNIKGKFGSKGYHAEQLHNHKVVSVEFLPEKMTVAALTIDQEETYHSHHTYLLDAGVYTKNTMLEDYWLPRREGGRGTEVTTLPGGQTLGQMDDVLYFQKKFLQALNVPISRLNSDALFSVGRATEITRDELKFNRFCIRLRGRFSNLFLEMLKKQLVLKGVTTLDDWKAMSDDIRFDFAKDNYFTELKDAEILEGRITQARNIQDMIGKYYSHEWVRKNVLHQSDDDIAKNDKQISVELKLSEQGEYRWVNPAILQNEQMQQQQDMMDQQMQDQMLQPGTEGSTGQDPELTQKMQQVRNAQIIVDQMKKMPKANRTMSDEAKYKAAVQILAKNQDLVSRVRAGGEPQQ